MIYLLIGIAVMVGVEFLNKKTTRLLISNPERILGVLIWPLILIFFILAFIFYFIEALKK